MTCHQIPSPAFTWRKQGRMRKKIYLVSNKSIPTTCIVVFNNVSNLGLFGGLFFFWGKIKLLFLYHSWGCWTWMDERRAGKRMSLTIVSQECKDALDTQILSSKTSQTVWCWELSATERRRLRSSAQLSHPSCSDSKWAMHPVIVFRQFSLCTAQLSGMEEWWCTCPKQTIQALQELASAFWSYSCKNLLKAREGECYLLGVAWLLLLYLIHARSSRVNHLWMWGFLWHGWPNPMYRLQFEVSRVLKNEMFLKVKLQ